MGLFSSSDEDEDEEEVDRGGFDTDDAIRSTLSKRVIDEEAGVVIYAVAYQRAPHGYGYGLTAVPISDTELEIESEDDENPDD